MKFFSLDSGFHKYGTILFDLIVLSTFWLLTVFATIGLLTPLANAAMFNSMNHTIIEEDGYMMQSYFTVYKKKFVKSLGLTLIGILMFGMASFNIYTVTAGIFNAPFLLPLYLLIFSEVTVIFLYATALLAQTDMTIKQLIKYGFLLSNKHILVTLSCLASIVALGYLCLMYNPMLIIIGIGPLFWLHTWLIYTKVFSNYYLDKLV